MSEEVTVRRQRGASPAATQAGFWLDRIARAFASTDVPFDMYFPDGGFRRFGQGAPSFNVRLNNRNAVRAITSLDQVSSPMRIWQATSISTATCCGRSSFGNRWAICTL